MNKEQQMKNFLTEWSSCPNRCTAFPYYWTIADEETSYLLNKLGEYVYDYNNVEMRKISDILQEMHESSDIDIPEDTTFEEILNSIGDVFESEVVEESLKKYINEEHLDRYEAQYETYYEGVFFTEKDAEEYLESCKNHHFGPNPRVYLESFNKWGRHSRTEEFLKNIFEYFEVPLPPELYYKNKGE